MADLGSLLGSAGIGGAIGKAIVSLELDTAKYTAEMKAAQAQTTASANSMSSGLAAFGGIAKAGMLAAGAAVVAFGAHAIKAASDLGESVNKSTVVFGANASAIRTWADTGAEAFGLSARASLDAAANFGTMLQSAGLATDASADMSQALVELSGDLASFNNVDPTIALEKLRAGLAGEAEPLRQFGVFISEAAVQAEAYRSGIAEVGTELTEAQKVQARYNIIFEQTNKQQGDFQRTADSLPNQLRSIRAEFENVSAEAGEKLLPVMVDLLKVFNDLIPVIGVVADHLGVLMGPVGLITDLMGESGFAGSLEAVERQLKPTAVATLEFGSAVGRDALPAVQAFIPILWNGVESQREFAAATEEATTAMREQVDAALALADSTFAVIDSVRSNEEAEKAYAQAVEHVNKLQREGKTDTKAYAEAKRELHAAALDAAESELDLSGAVRQLQQDIALGKTTRAEAIDSIRELGRAAGLSGEDIRGLVTDIRSGLTQAAATARRLAPQVGAAMMEGIALGVTTRSELVSVAAADAVHDAMQAARDAAKAGSPSKEMMKLGVDLMVGLANGISDAEQKAIDAARKAMEKVIDQVSSQLDKIKGKAQSFADAIKGGFSGFLDIGGAFGSAEEGTSLSGIIATQVGGAQTLADVLEALKRQGAGKALLAQVAESGAGFGQALLQGGPEQIKEANAALKTIADLAQQTGKGLSEKFFGDKIDSVEKKLDKLHDDLRELNALEREGHSHDIVMDGQKVAEATRSELIKTGKRNPGTGIE